jgi:hypothetical protein
MVSEDEIEIPESEDGQDPILEERPNLEWFIHSDEELLDEEHDVNDFVYIESEEDREPVDLRDVLNLDTSESESNNKREKGETVSKFFAAKITDSNRISPETFPKCFSCFNCKRTCDGNRPCSSCIKFKRPKSYRNVTPEVLEKFPGRAERVLVEHAAKDIVLENYNDDFLVQLPVCNQCYKNGSVNCNDAESRLCEWCVRSHRKC